MHAYWVEQGHMLNDTLLTLMGAHLQALALAVSAFCAADAANLGSHRSLVEQLARRVEQTAHTLSEQQCKVGSPQIGQ